MAGGAFSEARSEGRKLTPRIIERKDWPPSPGISNQFLMGKISPPPLPGWTVSRPRIDRLIDKGVRCGTVTLVSGPPGAGKTVALAHWQGAGGPGPVAWLTLDEYDDAVGHFWYHLAAALAQVGVPVPTAFNGDRDAPLLLASALAALETPAVLVLDNLHKVRSAERLAGLGYLLGHAQPGLRVVTGTRVNEPLPLHQFRLTGDLTEIRAGQLSSTGSETTRLLSGCDMTSYQEALMPLVKRTEGWVAGLRFVALALGGGEAAGLSQLDQLIGGYLLSEAFETQAPQARDTLLRTCVPERITQGLARALADHDHPGAALAELAAANLFIAAVGDGWYRYHPLFRDALRARLRKEDPGLFAGLLRRTAEWHRRHGQLADAVRCAAEAGDGELAARMVVGEMAVSRVLEPDRGQALAARPAGDAADRVRGRRRLRVRGGARPGPRRPRGGCRRARPRRRAPAPLPPEEEPSARLGAAEIRLAMARRAGDARVLADAAAEQEAAVATATRGPPAGPPGTGGARADRPRRRGAVARVLRRRRKDLHRSRGPRRRGPGRRGPGRRSGPGRAAWAGSRWRWRSAAGSSGRRSSPPRPRRPNQAARAAGLARTRRTRRARRPPAPPPRPRPRTSRPRRAPRAPRPRNRR